jgi:hypothetical protein
METLARWVFTAFGPGTPPTQILTSLQRNGLDLMVGVEGVGPEGTLRASKRVLLTIAEMTAPAVAVPSFRFGEVEVAPRAEEPERCVATHGDAITVPAGTTVRVIPLGSELPRLSHYADGGAFALGATRPDLVPWTAPASPGRVTHWLVAQRSAMRMSGPAVDAVAFCRFEVEVR